MTGSSSPDLEPFRMVAPDAESQAWVTRLRGVDPARNDAIVELHERMRREARFEIARRARGLAEFPASDIDDLAVQAADDALMALLRKLDDYRGDSQFWTWARRFAQLEAPVSIRRRLGHDHLAWGDPDAAPPVVDPGPSPHECAEARQLMQTVSTLIVEQLTQRQRTVMIAVTIKGVSTDALADDLKTTSGAIYKTLFDARTKLRNQLALCEGDPMLDQQPLLSVRV